MCLIIETLRVWILPCAELFSYFSLSFPTLLQYWWVLSQVPHGGASKNRYLALLLGDKRSSTMIINWLQKYWPLLSLGKKLLGTWAYLIISCFFKVSCGYKFVWHLGLNPMTEMFTSSYLQRVCKYSQVLVKFQSGEPFLDRFTKTIFKKIIQASNFILPTLLVNILTLWQIVPCDYKCF